MDRTIDRRSFLKRSAVAGTAAVGLSVYGLGDLEALAAKGRHVRWGALCLEGDQQTSVREMERKVGRRFATTHYRMPWTSDLVNGFTRWSASSDHTQVLSWFARTKSGPVSWRSIADGHHDAWITRQARSLRGTGWDGFIAFHKEPEDEGTAEDWQGAYRRVRTIFDNVGVSRFRWVVTLMASTYLAGDAARWIPDRYDLLGVDGYNRYRCRGVDWRSFSKIFRPARSFARARGKDLYIMEIGCVEAEAGRKAEWIRDARATIKRWPEIVGLSYNHENTDCNYYLTSSQSSLDAFKAMGSDRHFQKR
jgi:hypothetical protein